MVNSNLDFFPYSTERRSKSKEANPEPVPPPNERKTKNPCKELHCSVSFPTLSTTSSIFSRPTVK
uniref:Uncharacterized protein n=1 Tax=Amphimedon queenslandica TaxID=400682 RepID=A0A1X7UP06_AMPQE